MTDRQAFILQDMENRNREDVSDYERAREYSAAMVKYFNGSQKEMAAFLQIDPSNFSKLLDLEKLPKAIINAYADVRELKLHHGVTYKKLLADPETNKRVMDRARAIAENPLPGKKVLSALKQSGRIEPGSKQIKRRQFGSLVLTRKHANGRLSIDCRLPEQMDEEAMNTMRADFEKLLAEMMRETKTK